MELNREQDMEKRLINQREEIRRLQNRIHKLTQSRNAHREKAERLGKQLHEVLCDKKELTEENERLRESNLVFAHGVEKVAANYYNLGCTDTVRKMQERLKEAPIKVGLPLLGLQTKDEIEDYANGLILQMRDAIDQIAKEMLDDNT